jgi:antitoxin ParD1/3/4
MNTMLTAEQEKFIQAKLQTGKYRNAQELLELAFKLLDEYEQGDADWINSVREKIDAAIAMSQQTSLKSVTELDPWTQSLVGTIQLGRENPTEAYVDYLEEKYR